MIERLVYQAVTDGIALCVAEPDLLVDFFVTEGLLEEAEAVKLRDFFLANPPHVIHGYARPDSKFPLFAITLSSDTHDTKFIGNEGGFHDDPDDPQFGADDYAEIRHYMVTVFVYATHPDIALFYYHLLKHFIVAAESFFQNTGDYFDVLWSGADLAPDSTTMPAGLFLRHLQLEAKRQYTQPKLGSKLGRAWKVSGLHLKAEGAPGEDIGNVTPGVTTYSGGSSGDEEE